MQIFRAEAQLYALCLSLSLSLSLILALAFQPIDRFGPVRNLELVVDFVDVLLDGTIGDAEELADFFVQ